ncbi:unnamed protein product [Miscanthus lutarioriparius]|uniref:Uncharacterized protein n=1 Tax=Miscanthus lutarioriparius TaxID=422564 RepID=A0A811PP35_9POAL|nr:unnamed protein product [Miscanthus lutarioriparius]
MDTTADASYILVGLPEARQHHTVARAMAAAAEPVATGDEFLDLMALTENCSPTFMSSGDPCLDFFFHVVPSTPVASVESLLGVAWAIDSAVALRLVANLHDVVVRCLFPKGFAPELAADLADKHYAYHSCERLRKAALVPLRRTLKLSEVFISTCAWESVAYMRVASVAMKNYKELFLKHDTDRFNSYLTDVKSSKKRITICTLLPHKIITSLGDDGNMADLQWQRMVDDMRTLDRLSNYVAMCDVSRSIEQPKLHKIAGETLYKKTSFVRTMDWGMNTNFKAVFDKILKVAMGARLALEWIVRCVFVFSNMEFDQASVNPWETDYEAIVRKFTDVGYGATMLEVVF